MTHLVKFCKPEHNILDQSHTIRLGTFEYYRELDPSFAISDPDEGMESIDINSIDTTTASLEAVQAVSPIAPMPYISIENLRLTVIFPNCFIFCCSRIPDAKIATKGQEIDDSYVSHYRIKDAGQFAEHLMSLLMKNITRNEFNQPCRKIVDEFSIADMGNINLSVFHRDMLYVDQKLSTIDDGKLNPFVQEIPRIFRPIFVKPSKYAEDREYRFVFLFQHSKYGPLAVQKEPVDLPVIPISGT